MMSAVGHCCLVMLFGLPACMFDPLPVRSFRQFCCFFYRIVALRIT